MKVITDFAAAHTIRDYPGDCSRLHGHNWKVEVEVCAETLNEIGMGMDFKQIKATTQQIIQTLDHRNLNDIPPFDAINPTAENIASHLYRGLADKINTQDLKVSAVTLWETDRACVTYTEHPFP